MSNLFIWSAMLKSYDFPESEIYVVFLQVSSSIARSIVSALPVRSLGCNERCFIRWVDNEGWRGCGTHRNGSGKLWYVKKIDKVTADISASQPKGMVLTAISSRSSKVPSRRFSSQVSVLSHLMTWIPMTKADKQHANMYVNKQSVIHSTAIYDSVYQKLRYHAPISTKSCTLNYESVYQHLRNHLP